jgi:hypothetical protein
MVGLVVVSMWLPIVATHGCAEAQEPAPPAAAGKRLSLSEASDAPLY